MDPPAKKRRKRAPPPTGFAAWGMHLQGLEPQQPLSPPRDDILSYLEDDLGSGPPVMPTSIPQMRPMNMNPGGGGSVDDSDSDDTPVWDPSPLQRMVCQTPNQEVRQQSMVMPNESENRMEAEIDSHEDSSDMEDEDDYDALMSGAANIVVANPPRDITTIRSGMGEESSAYETDVRKKQGDVEEDESDSDDDDIPISPPPPLPSPSSPQIAAGWIAGDDDNRSNNQDLDLDIPPLPNNMGRIECVPCRQDAEVWCFGCKWGATGYRPADNERISHLVSEFSMNLLSGMSTIANVAIDTANLYEQLIRKTSIENGHPLPRWPAWAVERHIRNMREPQVRMALVMEDMISLMEKTSKHIVNINERSGSEKLQIQAGRLYLSTVKHWMDLSRMNPSGCFGYNAQFRVDPSRYATLVDSSRIAPPRVGDIRPGRPHCPGAPIASLPGQRGARGPSYSMSGADSGELRLPGNGEELLRRTAAGVPRMGS